MAQKVLVVDDEENICFTLGRFLSDEGYQENDHGTKGTCCR